MDLKLYLLLLTLIQSLTISFAKTKLDGDWYVNSAESININFNQNALNFRTKAKIGDHIELKPDSSFIITSDSSLRETPIRIKGDWFIEGTEVLVLKSQNLEWYHDSRKEFFPLKHEHLKFFIKTLKFKIISCKKKNLVLEESNHNYSIKYFCSKTKKSRINDVPVDSLNQPQVNISLIRHWKHGKNLRMRFEILNLTDDSIYFYVPRMYESRPFPEFFNIDLTFDKNFSCIYSEPMAYGYKGGSSFLCIAPGSKGRFETNSSAWQANICGEGLQKLDVSLTYRFNEKILFPGNFMKQVFPYGKERRTELERLYENLQKCYRHDLTYNTEIYLEKN